MEQQVRSNSLHLRIEFVNHHYINLVWHKAKVVGHNKD